LQDKLHGGEREIKKSSSSSVISWRNRMEIAYQLAQALEYLHEKCPLQIVHGDIKPSNILLDEQLNCKLCDFGFAKMGFSSTIMTSNNRKQVMMGSPGYTDPHYLRTGIASKKNDVYSYGVIILELVTGMEAFCEEREQGQLLSSIMGPILKDIIASDNECKAMKEAEMVDPRLGEDFEVKEVKVMLSLAALCLGQSPSLRPSATQILHTIKENIASISFISTQKKDLSN
jgi:serine/threonine protein kinase